MYFINWIASLNSVWSIHLLIDLFHTIQLILCITLGISIGILMNYRNISHGLHCIGDTSRSSDNYSFIIMFLPIIAVATEFIPLYS
jgi:hypothetical protein